MLGVGCWLLDVHRMNSVGIDLGGTQIKGVVVTADGEILRRELRETKDDDTNGRAWAETIHGLADELGRDLPLGLSAPGLAARDRRAIAHLPGRLHGLEGLDWTELSRPCFACPGSERRAGLAARRSLARRRARAARCNSAHPRHRRRRRDSRGREIAPRPHRACRSFRTRLPRCGWSAQSIVGTPGALECAIGNYNIRERTGDQFATTHDLIAAFRAGDDFAREIWLKSIRALACAIDLLHQHHRPRSDHPRRRHRASR